ncbi:MAG: pilus assembly FimT family protein [Thainema sp.]
MRLQGGRRLLGWCGNRSSRRFWSDRVADGTPDPAPQASGFTLLEILIVLFIVGILMLIVAPSWNGLLTRQQLNVAQSDAHQIIRQAQLEAIHRRTPWQASFRQVGDQVEWASHAVTLPPAKATWQPLTSVVKIDTAETTFPKASGVYRMRFNYQGHVNGQLGRLTFTGHNGGRLKRCVFVSTLLGALRDAKNQGSPDKGGRYCY